MTIWHLGKPAIASSTESEQYSAQMLMMVI